MFYLKFKLIEIVDERGENMEQDMEYGNAVERKLFAWAETQLSPLYGVLELTPLCNMNCDMCYVRLSRKEMESKGRMLSLDEWLMLAKEMKDAGVLFILLTGGEPLLYPHFKELYLELLNMGMVITINSNGTLMDETWIDFFSQHKPRRINITLYGKDEQGYTDLCHYPEGFEKAVNAIKRLKEKNVAVKINCSLTKKNINSYQKILDIGEKLDVPVFMDTYMTPATRERDKPFDFASRLDPKEAAKTRIQVLRREMGDEVFIQSAKLHIDLALNTPAGKEIKGGMKCKAGKCSFTVNWRGDMIPCVIMNEPSAPVIELGFDKAWKMIVEKTSQIYMSEKCSQCTLRKVCNVCPSYSLLEAGAYDAIPEYLCQYTKYTIDYFKEELEKMENENEKIEY